MPEPIPPCIPSQMVEVLRAARSVVILTGAGISAESGIPTFRDSQTGLWARYDPHELATPQAFERDPRLVMSWYRWRSGLVAQSQPNSGHSAIAEIERRVPEFTLITQNVDGLHIQAGSQKIIELHGNINRLRCTACSYSVTGWPEDPLPTCPKCGNLLRPDVVWFGEPLPANALRAALEASRRCDMFFSIGTSGVVEPAASLPYEALRAGATVVEVNPQPTPLSVYTKFYCPAPAGNFLSTLVKQTWDA
jgi:NAD-dependent deacetylase